MCDRKAGSWGTRPTLSYELVDPDQAVDRSPHYGSGVGVRPDDASFARPLTEDGIGAFERRHQVVLPTGYRDFLLRFGCGGPGPYYGLLPLEAEEPPPGVMARACVLDPALEDRDSFELEDFDEERPSGTMASCDQGCTFYTFIILTGPHRGRLVNLETDSSFRFVPDQSFLAWYERWLDELLSGIDVSWFGYSAGGQSRS